MFSSAECWRQTPKLLQGELTLQTMQCKKSEKRGIKNAKKMHKSANSKKKKINKKYASGACGAGI